MILFSKREIFDIVIEELNNIIGYNCLLRLNQERYEEADIRKIITYICYYNFGFTDLEVAKKLHKERTTIRHGRIKILNLLSVDNFKHKDTLEELYSSINKRLGYDIRDRKLSNPILTRNFLERRIKTLENELKEKRKLLTNLQEITC